MTDGPVRVEFVTDRGERKAGDRVMFDPASAEHIVNSGAAIYVELDGGLEEEPAVDVIDDDDELDDDAP